MPSTRRRVPEVASPPQTPPFARLDIGIGYRIPMGEVVVPRPHAHPRISLARAHRSLRASPPCAVRPDRAAARGSIFARVREGRGSGVGGRKPKISPMLLPAVFSRGRGSGVGTPLWVGRRKPTHREHPRKSSVPDSVMERRAWPPATRKGATARAVTPHARETRLRSRIRVQAP